MNLLPLFKFRILPSTISKVTPHPPLPYAQDITKMLILRCSPNYIVLCIYCGLCYFSPITFCSLLRYLEVGGSSSHLNNIFAYLLLLLLVHNWIPLFKFQLQKLPESVVSRPLHHHHHHHLLHACPRPADWRNHHSLLSTPTPFVNINFPLIPGN